MARKLVTSKSTTTTNTALVVAPATTPAVVTPAPAPAPIPNQLLVAHGTERIDPKPGSVFFAALAVINAGNATLPAIQAAINALGKKGKHDAMVLLRWQCKNRGWAFTINNGIVTLA